MSVEAALRRVCEIVEATPPGDGGAFVWLDPDHGAVPELASAPEGPDRLFELADGRTVDAGEGGCLPSPRLRMAFALRLRYRRRGSRHGRAAVQADDVRRIRDALMFAPSSWRYASTGLLSVLMGEASAPEPLAPDEVFEAAVHEVVSVPLTLEIDP